MKREVVITADGSSTIHLPDWDEQYHSKHGAIQEAYHVFIKHGLHHFLDTEQISESLKKTSILEIGFGTGLNAFITYLESEKFNLDIDYFGVEGYPVALEEIEKLNYPVQLKVMNGDAIFKDMHKATWEEKQYLSKKFTITKQHRFFSEIREKEYYNIIFFDAFGARVQPELWTEAIFQAMYNALKLNGILVTYSAKGSVRRAMQAVGFKVEKLPGPPGKREMLRACKEA